MRDNEREFRESQFGEADGRHENERRRWYEEPRRTLLRTTHLEDSAVEVRACSFEVTKPDPRITLTLTVAFAVVNRSNLSGANDVRDMLAGDGVAVGVHLTEATARIVKCEHMTDVAEVEDVHGTRAAQEAFVALGCYGGQWEVDEDCEVVRGELTLPAVGVEDGRWEVKARWCAIDPMSDADWFHARSRMQLVVREGRPIDGYRLPEGPT